MEISEVRIKLTPNRRDKLRAFCCITLDNLFLIRDLRVIETARGVFVAMPSRKLMDRCPRCAFRNAKRARFCNDCGTSLPPPDPAKASDTRGFHKDIAHPISAEARELLHKFVLAAYFQEVERSRAPGYRPVELYDSPDEYDLDDVSQASR